MPILTSFIFCFHASSGFFVHSCGFFLFARFSVAASAAGDFFFVAVRNLSFTVTEFNLFTAYNAPGQENITDEEDKEKIMVQPIIESIEKCSKEQLEDIVNGWMRHIKKVFKLYEQKVSMYIGNCWSHQLNFE